MLTVWYVPVLHPIVSRITIPKNKMGLLTIAAGTSYKKYVTLRSEHY